ncbi:hypothetical protein M0638_01165 [Roseomonas sp. NAR14]|uniref:DUF4105 domain-containing protein n=1 Tax=Roseomonas acroporae TaxID=2937791 RepID=A0A9X1Y2K6_9PROT|nr:hypothetical protein [Roseomonas acroporae]MCK8782989.1 hypothetical protein [Roseomonas acroporae]
MILSALSQGTARLLRPARPEREEVQEGFALLAAGVRGRQSLPRGADGDRGRLRLPRGTDGAEGRRSPPRGGARRRNRVPALLAALWLSGCAAADFDLGHGSTPPEAAAAVSPALYAEFCAVSQIRKRPGFGADIRGGIGGHAVFYLHGACRDRDARYPVLRLCDPSRPGEPEGAGLSMNSNYRNAKWVATDGPGFFFEGGLRPGERLTRARYRQAQAEAAAQGIFDGVEFHETSFAAMPPGMSRRDWMYEISVATDYAIAFGRGRYCARVPVGRAAMGRMVAFLNAENAPYRAGQREFRWNIFNDNCAHLAHNALAAAGLWAEWPTGRPLLVSVFDFPVPRNEFVNTALRANDMPIDDLDAVWADAAARRSVLRAAELPTRPGALVSAVPPWRDNDLYETDLALIFYDDAITSRYQRRFDRLFAEARFHDAEANLAHFAALYARIRAARQPPEGWLRRHGQAAPAERARLAAFHARYYEAVDAAAASVATRLALLRAAVPRGEASRADGPGAAGAPSCRC